MANTEQPFEMQAPDQWKAFSHPLRLRILELLANDARTNEELATLLGEQSGKLYFHTKKLLDAGLIVLDSTRQKGPITEKLYRAVARQFTAPALTKGGSAPPLAGLVALGLDFYRTVWEETGGLPDQGELGGHLVLPMAPERRREFAVRVQALMEDFKTSGSEAPDAKPVALTVLLHEADTRKADTKETEKNDALAEDTVAADGSPADRPREAGPRGRRR